MRGDQTPFDGKYTNPNIFNREVEWWWTHAVADNTVGGNAPASVQVVFFMGYLFDRPIPVISPEFYITIDGTFPDGSIFSESLIAADAIISHSGEKIHGNWWGVGEFTTSSDFKTFDINLHGLLNSVQGTIHLEANAPHHFACNTTSTPYFAPATPEGQLTDDEKVVYNQIGWPVATPGGKATIDLKVKDKSLQFQGTGYHDHNWMPQPIQEIISTWHFGQATVGPYTLSYLRVQPSDTERSLTTGFLARNGIILQNQCSVGKTGNDRSVLTPWGLKHSDESGVDVPQGYIIEYFLTNGEHYRFNLTEQIEVSDMDKYHRSVGSISGGKDEEEPVSGYTVFEWLNPGLAKYVPSS
ncbi:hypothetical protein K474DRAFT_1684555 [Panus rudis PR-1116 ss-1]|nr:hypothetical protein K474DRAFT_1684555 [Panus rudis PR-1116 ss-1]